MAENFDHKFALVAEGHEMLSEKLERVESGLVLKIDTVEGWFQPCLNIAMYSISEYGVGVRYPDLYYEPSLDEAFQAYAIAKEIVSLVEDFISH